MNNKFILALTSLFSISLASAYSGYSGYYGGSVFGSLFSYISVNLNSVIFMLIFIIVYFAIYWAMSKNKSIRNLSWPFALIGAMFTTFMFWRNGLDFQKILSNIGLGNMLVYIIPLLIVALLIILTYKWKLKNMMLVLSGISFFLAILNSGTNPSNTAMFSVVGVILLTIGILMKLKRTRKTRFSLSTLILFFSVISLLIGIFVTTANQTLFILIGLGLLILGVLMKFKKKGPKNEYSKYEEKVEENIHYLDQAINEEKKQPAEYQNKNRLTTLLKIKKLEEHLENLSSEAARYQNELDKAKARTKSIPAETGRFQNGEWAGSKEGQKLYKEGQKLYKRITELEKNVLPSIRNEISNAQRIIESLKKQL